MYIILTKLHCALMFMGTNMVKKEDFLSVIDRSHENIHMAGETHYSIFVSFKVVCLDLNVHEQ